MPESEGAIIRCYHVGCGMTLKNHQWAKTKAQGWRAKKDKRGS